MSPEVARLYGPAVRCKLNLQSGGDWACASLSGPYAEQIAPGHHGYPRASDLTLGQSPRGPVGPPDHERDGETVPPSSSNLTRRPRRVVFYLPSGSKI